MPPDKPKRPVGADRPFPWRCRHCGKIEVRPQTIPYAAEVRHKGRLVSLNIPNLEMPICQVCGERVFTEDVDRQIDQALQLHLNDDPFDSEEIEKAREEIKRNGGLTTAEAIAHLEKVAREAKGSS
jgi:hypothetical protein